jgi:cytidine deaminase
MEPTIPEHLLKQLFEEARRIALRAYAPYSGFYVGCALLDEQHQIHTGCNVENASYGLSQCAERGAITSAVAKGSRRFVAAAIVSPSSVTPCGACRQVLVEFGPRMLIAVSGLDAGSPINFYCLEDLLPHRFSGRSLPAPPVAPVPVNPIPGSNPPEAGDP